MKKLKRREFFKYSLAGTGGALCSNLITKIPFIAIPDTAYALSSTGKLSHVEAKYYKKLEHKEIECQLCPKKCKVGDRERGYCGVRENKKGIYYTLVYGLACSFHKDPIEKKHYREICRGNPQPVLDTLKELKKIGIWYEIVYLMVPTLNDDMKDIKKMCEWILSNLGPDVPVHFTRFIPLYLLKNLPPTPVSSLEQARKIAQESGLKFVYIGNVGGHEGENTYCPKCKKILVGRYGFTITQMN